MHNLELQRNVFLKSN